MAYEFKEYPKHLHGRIVKDSLEEAALLKQVDRERVAEAAKPREHLPSLVEVEPDPVGGVSLDEIRERRGPGRPPKAK